MNKFKIRDFVEVVGNSNNHGRKIGDVLRINRVDTFYDNNISIYYCDDCKFCFVEKDLKEQETLKEGDFVKVVENTSYHSFKVGDILEITDLFYDYSLGDVIGYMCKNKKGKIDGIRRTDVKKEICNNDNKVITITFKGNSTYATLKENGRTLKEEKVGLYHGDEYDMDIGVQEVVKKLLGVKEKKVKEVKRGAKAGEYVKIVFTTKTSTPTTNGIPDYEVGDVLKMISNCGHYGKPSDRCGKSYNDSLYKVLNTDEYVVLEGYEE